MFPFEKKYDYLKHPFLPLFILVVFTLSAFSLPTTDYTLTVYTDNKTYVYAYPEIYPYFGQLKMVNAQAAVQRIVYDNTTPPNNAQTVFTPTNQNPFYYIPEKPGRQPDERALYTAILNALKNRTAEIRATYREIQPSFTIEQAKTLTTERGRFSTIYATSSEDRKQNVYAASEKINGSIIKCGETFSFNLTVGDRTKENGYREAKIIQNGKFTDGIGGGVCQVSTTLYNAALLSDIIVTERHAHSVAVNYVEPSFDAAVSYGWHDLKLQNNTAAPVYIICRADGYKLEIIIYGKPNDYNITRISEVYKKTNPGYEITTDESGDLCGDEREKILIPPKYAISSMGRLFYQKKNQSKNDGTKQNKFYVLLSEDYYRGIKGVIATKG